MHETSAGHEIRGGLRLMPTVPPPQSDVHGEEQDQRHQAGLAGDVFANL